jgi:integrase
MNENTKEEYRRLAKHFYTKHGIVKPTAKTVCDALKDCATDYRPDYWRRLRTALALVAKESGFYKAENKIRATINPITADRNKRSQIKPKQKRQKKISKIDEDQLLDYLTSQQEKTVYAAVTLVSDLGCRPAELRRLEFIAPRYVSIPSAKKTADGKRGLDRIIVLNSNVLFLQLKESYQHLAEATCKDPIRYVQRRLDTLTKRLWPNRKVRPSLYTWRHQLGADLKASDMPREEISAIMGHQSINSVEVYGNPRSSKSSRSYMKPDKETVQKVKQRNSHKLTKLGETFSLNDISEIMKQQSHSTKSRFGPRNRQDKRL